MVGSLGFARGVSSSPGFVVAPVLTPSRDESVCPPFHLERLKADLAGEEHSAVVAPPLPESTATPNPPEITAAELSDGL